MLVSKVIDELKKLDPNSNIFIKWLDRNDFLTEFSEWNDNEPLTPTITDDEWEGIVEGTMADDRIEEALMESLHFDFKELNKKRYEVELLEREIKDTEQDQELWEA